ncbi:MAG: hypothetical protein ABSF29_09270 [Tepidisphaeraceae bacterium]
MGDLVSRGLKQTARIAVFAFFVGVAIPAAAALWHGVFYEECFVKRIGDNIPKSPRSADWLSRIIAFQHETSALKSALRDLGISIRNADAELAKANCSESVVATTQPSERLDSLVALQSKIAQALQDRPLVVVPFYGSLYTPLWFWTFLTIGVMLRVFYPGAIESILPRGENIAYERWSWKTTWWVGAGIFLFFEWPSWYRYAFPPRGEVIPSALFYTNFYADKLSCFIENALDLLYSVLLAAIWGQWLSFYAKLKTWPLSDAGDDFARTIDPIFARRLSAAFLHWVIMSTLLASSYVFDTVFYWRIVTASGGANSILQAVLEHTVWAVSWIILSLPLIYLYWSWTDMRAKALSGLNKKGEPTDGQRWLLEQSKPLSVWVVVVANAGAVIAFLFSLYNAVVH